MITIDSTSQRRIIYILLLVLSALMPEAMYSTSSGAVSFLTYQFTHVNILHFMANLFAIVALMETVCVTIDPWKTIMVSYMASVVSALLSVQVTPTCGMSGMAFFMIGMFYAFAFGGKILMIRRVVPFYVGLLTTAIFVIASFFVKNLAAINHLIALIIGILYGILENMQYRRYYK